MKWISQQNCFDSVFYRYLHQSNYTYLFKKAQVQSTYMCMSFCFGGIKSHPLDFKMSWISPAPKALEITESEFFHFSNWKKNNLENMQWKKCFKWKHAVNFERFLLSKGKMFPCRFPVLDNCVIEQYFNLIWSKTKASVAVSPSNEMLICYLLWQSFWNIHFKVCIHCSCFYNFCLCNQGKNEI